MKAAQYKKFGGPEVIEINEVEIPGPKKSQVLVKVHATSINPIDWKVRNGRFKLAPMLFPVTIGGNFSGVVEKLGETAGSLRVGDEVYGTALVLNGGSGSTAQYCVANVRNTAIKPKNIDHIKAAAFPLVGISALQALWDDIKLKKGEKILIEGGAGGIGSVAVQLAKYLGAYVVTTVAGKDMKFAKSLGADEVYNYEKDKIDKEINDMDAVFDVSGRSVKEKSLKVLKKGGVISSMTGFPDEVLKEKYGIKAIGVMTSESKRNLNKLRELIENNVVDVQINKIFKLKDTAKAYKYQEEVSTRGKVIIKIV